jgi:hypothetical protein
MSVLLYTSTYNGESINLNGIQRIKKDDRGGNYKITFFKESSSVDWEYDNQSDRDAELTLIRNFSLSVDVVDYTTDNWEYNKSLVGIQDGINATFTTPDAFVAGKVDVIVNGQTQTLAVDYNISGLNTIIFTFSPSPSEVLKANYIKAT